MRLFRAGREQGVPFAFNCSSALEHDRLLYFHCLRPSLALLSLSHPAPLHFSDMTSRVLVKGPATYKSLQRQKEVGVMKSLFPQTLASRAGMLKRGTAAGGARMLDVRVGTGPCGLGSQLCHGEVSSIFQGIFHGVSILPCQMFRLNKIQWRLVPQDNRESISFDLCGVYQLFNFIHYPRIFVLRGRGNKLPFYRLSPVYHLIDDAPFPEQENPKLFALS